MLTLNNLVASFFAMLFFSKCQHYYGSLLSLPLFHASTLDQAAVKTETVMDQMVRVNAQHSSKNNVMRDK